MSGAPDRRGETGPFDIIGDVHGCADELQVLLAQLGYDVKWEGIGHDRRCVTRTPAGRRAVFLGDYVDRGPKSLDTLRLVMSMVESGQALGVLGNHDARFVRWLDGRNVQMTHGLAETANQMRTVSPAFRQGLEHFLDRLPFHLWLDGGELAVAHAGIRRDMLGHTTSATRAFCLYGDTTGERDEFGFPVRRNWAARYNGTAAIVYGHTPIVMPDWVNNTICIDTGCCFGGQLTALRWPERELVSVPAFDVYTTPVRPLPVTLAAAGEP
ncbi:MAG: protein phosphatase [Sphingomonadales bacterium]|nr:protein phosphatase [Sphingomonadales bacterium]